MLGRLPCAVKWLFASAIGCAVDDGSTDGSFRFLERRPLLYAGLHHFRTYGLVSRVLINLARAAKIQAPRLID